MAVHIPHADSADVGLTDGCPRCAELAEHPVKMDPLTLRRHWDRMLLVEYGDAAIYRSTNEKRACSWLYEVSLIASKLGVDPGRMFPRPALFDHELHDELERLKEVT